MLRLVPAGGFVYVCLLVVQQEQMSTRVNLSCSSKRKRRRFVVATGSPAASCDWNQQREALRCFVLATGYPAAGVISCATSFELLPESSGFLTGLVVAQYKDVRASGNTALSSLPHSHLPAGIVATMCRVVNYHSSWARQQQVELFDASGKWV
ncbi:hypothetical protein F511_32925 [Dorcoceras hygrometricum]|uniref:Uncharacterized protein n=1 Tax=Dorcoceras hygrometricum TaxID=472368 RepID=A0A2Z7AKG4_9LAMI|nr:hypothetical protein F511_32925 [Dorcoceras hygrometricum]